MLAPSRSVVGFCWTAVSIFYNSALRFIHVSFLNTMKSSIPFWTCLICRVYFKEEFSMLTYFSLAPILGAYSRTASRSIFLSDLPTSLPPSLAPYDAM